MAHSFRTLVENGTIWKLCMAGSMIPLGAMIARATIQGNFLKHKHGRVNIKEWT